VSRSLQREPEGAATDNLRFAEAKLRVWQNREAVGDVVAAAVSLLESGLDTPSLRILAGEDHSEPHEVQRVLNATLRELGLAPQERREAILTVAARLAGEGLADRAHAETVAPILWRLYAGEPMTQDWPPSFVRLANAADGVEDLPWWEGSIPEFMEAAREFLATRG
jgi:hypothetical protein